MSNLNLHADVCVVGGGPAGTLLGYLLAQNGVSTIIIERTSGVSREFRGEHINGDTEAILREHELFDKIEELGLLRMSKVEYFAGKDIVKTILPANDEDHVGIHVPQSNLLSAIIKESEQYNHFQILYNSTVTGLIEDDNGFYAGVHAIKDGQEIEITSKIIVGADGRYSTVRKHANILTEQRKHGYDVLWAKIPAPQGWEPTTRMVFVDGHQLALFTQTGGRIQIGWNIEEGAFPSLKKGDLQLFLEPLVNSFPELEDIVLRNIQSWKDFVCLKVVSSCSETWVKDGLVIIGDAAHTMTPTGAIGINCGLLDAHVLAPIVTRALLENNTSAQYLKQFEKNRKVRINEQQEMQIKKEESFSEIFTQLELV
ncbi:FAD-dependent monooxygenase [Neobacillus sp. FSL H8-0543]|uniref:FAD-dependent monooxygenase n=1 Tax=Neobacillus sp. FSL H8-0543 TaxID=2954672 RepID=UPI003158E732